MLKNIFRKTFSVLLALTFVLASFSMANTSSLFPTASASVSTAKSAEIAPVTFVVPEVIYLTPTWDSYSSTREMSFQWYVNNTVSQTGDITLDTGEDTVGDIYFYYRDTDSVKIKFEWLDTDGVSTLGGRITFGDSTERSAGGEYTTVPSFNAIHIKSGMSPALDSMVTGVYLRWTATFYDKSDFRTKTATAYTYVYKPYPQAVGTAVHTLNDRGQNSNGDTISWISGVHDTDEATMGSYYPNTSVASSGKGLMPFSSSYNAGVKIDRLNAQFASAAADTNRFYYSGIADNSPTDWLNTNTSTTAVPDKSFHYLNNSIDTGSSGDYSVGAVTYSPNAVLTVDSSRYTNLNQIPNLSVGLMVTRDKGSTNGGAWFVADYTGTPVTNIVTIEYKNSTSTAESYWNKYSSGTLLAKVGNYTNGSGNNAWVTDAEREGVKYNGRWNRAISTGSTSGLYMVATGYFNHDSDSSTHYGGDTIWNFGEVRTSIRMVNKSKLRATVQKASANSALLTSDLYDTSSSYWKNYVALYHAACLALTKVDGAVNVGVNLSDKYVEYTSVEAIETAFDSALTALLNGNGLVRGTVTQTNIVLQDQGNGFYKCVELLGGNATCTTSYITGQSVTLSPEICPGYTFVGALKTQRVSSVSIGSTVSMPSSFTTSTAGAVFSADGSITYPRAGTAGTDNQGNIYYSFYYTPNSYTVTFNPNGGTGSMAQQSFVYNDPQALNANAFSKRGYNFLGWATNAEGTGTILADKESVSHLTTKQNGNVDLYAVWGKGTYTITFNANGGTILGNYATTYDIESVITLPNARKDGLTLSGWRADGAGNWGPLLYTASTPIAAGKYGNVALTAEWKPNEYTVTFNGNGATNGSMADQKFTYGTAQALYTNAFVRTGFSFLGWASTSGATQIEYSDKQIVSNLSAAAGAVIPLYAVWSANTYTISYNLDGGTIRDKEYSKTYTIEKSIQLPTNVEKTGYTFDGWETTTNAGNWTIGSSYAGTIDSGMYGGVTFSAKWTITNYTITYNKNGGTLTGTGYTSTYTISSVVTLPSAQKTGYRLSTWTADGSGNWGTESYTAGAVGSGMYGNVTLTAVWTGITYRVSFNGNQSTGGSMLIQSMVYGQSTELYANAYTRTGYNFLGWATTANATVPKYTDRASVLNLTSTADAVVTLYAVWSASDYTISYDVADGTLSANAPTLYKVSESLTLPTATRNGYVFAGWKPAENSGNWLTTTVYSGILDAGSVYGSVRLVAQWTTEQYTVNFITNGGTIVGNAPSSYDIHTTVILPVATRVGFNFDGWQATGWDNGVYPAGNYFNKTGDVVFSALWSSRPYTVQFNGNGAASGSMQAQTMNIDIEQALSANAFSRPGFSFTGWALTQGGEALYADGAKVLNLTNTDNEVVTLYACWKGIVFSISYDLNGIPGSMLSSSVTMEGAAVNLRENKNTSVEMGDKVYNFAGWALSKADADSGVVAVENQGTFSLKETDLASLDINWDGARPTIRLYAVWTEIEIAASIDAENSKAVVDREKGFIYGLELGITEQQIKDDYIEILGNARLEFEYSGFIGTGAKVNLISNVNGEVLETYTIVIFGDLNGDGVVNNQDIVSAKALAANVVEYNMSDAIAFAADLFADNNINNTDISILKAMQNGSVNVNQATREQIPVA